MMIVTREIRQWTMMAALLFCCGHFARAAQSAPREGRANVAAKSAQASGSAAEAAAYEKLKTGQVDEAAAAFQAILAAQPNDAGALAGMGQVRMLQGNYLGAVSFLEQAKQASPNDNAIAAALDSARFSFLMSEGHDAETAKDAVDAEKRYREALELRPEGRQAVDALVNVLVLENKLSDAQDELSTAVAREAASTGHPPADLEMQLAQLDIANSQPQLAYPIFLQVLQDSPGRIDAWSGLISSLHLMGHDADALAQEKAIPAATRAQLEATAGFQQMMTAMASAPAQAAPSGPSYAPFVPSEVPAAASAINSPASAPGAPTTAVSVPSAGGPQRSGVITNTMTAKPAMMQPAAKPAVMQPTPKPAAPSQTQTAHTHTEAAQATPPVRHEGHAGSGAPLVTQPATKPASHGEEIPDTGEQQYPQPKTRPRAAANAGSSSSPQQ